jgi:hypothetical protein
LIAKTYAARLGPEAARLLKAAWRLRQPWRGQPSDRPTAQHVARFILVALYTGTRAAAICSAPLAPNAGAGFIDLDNGVFYRRPHRRRPPSRPLVDCRQCAQWPPWTACGQNERNRI